MKFKLKENDRSNSEFYLSGYITDELAKDAMKGPAIVASFLKDLIEDVYSEFYGDEHEYSQAILITKNILKNLK